MARHTPKNASPDSQGTDRDADRRALGELRTEVERERSAIAAERTRLKRLRRAILARWKSRLAELLRREKAARAESAVAESLRATLAVARTDLDAFRDELDQRERRLDTLSLREGLDGLESRHAALSGEVEALECRAVRLRTVVTELESRRRSDDGGDVPFADIVAVPVTPGEEEGDILAFVTATTLANEWWQEECRTAVAQLDGLLREASEPDAGRSKRPMAA